MNSHALKASLAGVFILLLFPLHSAFAFKETNYTIQLEVEFLNTDHTKLLPMFADFDSGLIEQNIFDIFEPIAVGQFTQDNIIADWNIGINSVSKFSDFVIVNPDSSTSLVTVETNSKLVIDPLITEINTAQGVNKATIQDQIINDGVSQVKAWLEKYGIDQYIWTLHYDGGTQVIGEFAP